MPEQVEDDCNLAELAAIGAEHGLDSLDKVDSQAAIVYLLALTIKALGEGAPDYTDICALAKSLAQYDGLPDYARNAARLAAWGEITENTTGEEPSYDATLEAIRCAHCCGITKASMENAMTFLLCKLSSLIQPV